MAREEVAVDERSTGNVSGTIKKLNASGALVAWPLADITSIECTLIDVVSGTVLNSRQKQDVKNDNNCTMHATSGLFTWTFQVADTAIQSTTLAPGQSEKHLATFTVVGDSQQFHFEILLNVKNLHKVPQVSA